MFWKTLKDVDFSENTLRELPLHIFELEVSLVGQEALKALLMNIPALSGIEA